jgi:hypothetical protein
LSADDKLPPAGDDDWVPEDDAVIGRVFRRSLLVVGSAAVVVLAGVVLARGCRPAVEDHEIDTASPVEITRDVEPPEAPFSDVTADVGVAFVHHSGAYGEKLLPETMGGGVAIFDFDGDEDQDLLFVDSTRWPDSPPEVPEGRLALYLNDGSGAFEDASALVASVRGVYGTGVAVGDYDGDGDTDVFVAAVGPNRLLRNDGGEVGFVDVTEEAGVAGAASEWSSSSTFFDYDNDGDLDLFVGNYVRWSKQIDLDLDYRLTGVGRAYGPPINYGGTFPYLYRNEGDGRFVDVSAASGVEIRNDATGEPVAKSLGVTTVDADGDGWLDLFVANDTVRNFLLRNLGDGRFEDQGERYGIAYGRDGGATGAMGVDWSHFRNDDELGFLVANFANEMSSLYMSQGDREIYADESIVEGLGAPSRRMLSFGVFFFDFDLDGRLDVLQANGHLEEEINDVDPSQAYRQPLQLFWNGGEAGLIEVEGESLGDLANPIVGRAMAYGDLDGDGDLDVVVGQVAGPALVMRNDQVQGHHWLRVRLEGNGTSSNHDAIGAIVEIDLEAEVLRRGVAPSRSYQSQVELPLTFGLGSRERVPSLTVHWPDGSSSEHEVGEVDRLIVVRQASGGS